MGVTIHYRLGQEKEFVKSTLDSAQKVANGMKEEAKERGIDFKIKRENSKKLVIDIAGCESLMFDFKSVKKVKEQGKGKWDYENETLFKENGIGKVDEDLFYTSGFCKTQFAEDIIEHLWVADLIRVVASRCKLTDVSDEGDYYHTGKIEDAIKGIIENGKMIDKLGDMLGGLDSKKYNIVKGNTKIKE